MKRAALFIIVALVANLIALSYALAADTMIQAKVQSVQEGIAKNGTSFVRIIIVEKRQLNGVSYEAGVPVMAFGSVVTKARTVTPGQTIKAIVTPSEYQGKPSYTVHAILDK